MPDCASISESGMRTMPPAAGLLTHGGFGGGLESPRSNVYIPGVISPNRSTLCTVV